ncbi:MAG: hypothetical protein WKF34_02880 [Pyrinomonadaceae bacterium]
MARINKFRFTDKKVIAWDYRDKFVDSVEEFAPEVLDSLMAFAPTYKALAHDLSPALVSLWLSGELDSDSSDEYGRIYYIRTAIVDHFLTLKRWGLIDNSKLPEAADALCDRLLVLRTSFDEFLERYGLCTSWLRYMFQRQLADLSDGRKPARFIEFGFDIGIAAEGPPIEIQTDGWSVEESWSEFEARARAYFEAALARYKAAAIEQFRGDGYKQTTKPLDLSVVKWLVWWTVKRMSKEQILERIDDERFDDGRAYDIKTLEHHFRQLKKYGLPVRTG